MSYIIKNELKSILSINCSGKSIYLSREERKEISEDEFNSEEIKSLIKQKYLSYIIKPEIKKEEEKK